MSIRERFEFDLQSLQQQLVDMAEKTDKGLKNCVKSLLEKDIELALQVIEDDRPIDELEEEINDFAISLIARQQPVAIDLRRIIVAIQIVTDLERVADYAVNISKATIRIGESNLPDISEDVTVMMDKCRNMLQLAIQAYQEENVLLARKVTELDDEIDALQKKIVTYILPLYEAKEYSTNVITQLALIARYMERIGDHTENIAERTMYLVKGRHFIHEHLK